MVHLVRFFIPHVRVIFVVFGSYFPQCLVEMSSIAFLMNPSQPVPLAVLPDSPSHSVQRGWDSRREVTRVCTTFHMKKYVQLTQPNCIHLRYH